MTFCEKYIIFCIDISFISIPIDLSVLYMNISVRRVHRSANRAEIIGKNILYFYNILITLMLLNMGSNETICEEFSYRLSK